MIPQTQAANPIEVPGAKAPRTAWKALRAQWASQAQAGKIPPVPDFPISNVTYTKLCARIAAAATAGDVTALDAMVSGVKGSQTYARLTRDYAATCMAACAFQTISEIEQMRKGGA